jgi:hypothetical protein
MVDGCVLDHTKATAHAAANAATSTASAMVSADEVATTRAAANYLKPSHMFYSAFGKQDD